MSKKHECCKCKKVQEFLNEFGVYGGNPHKIIDMKLYCDECFEIQGEKYDKKYKKELKKQRV